MTRARIFGCVLIAALALSHTAAHSQELVSGLSTDVIQINSNFNGTDIVLFGAIEIDQTAQTKDQDLVIVIRGPSEDMTVRRKDQSQAGHVKRHAWLLFSGEHEAAGRYRAARNTPALSPWHVQSRCYGAGRRCPRAGQRLSRRSGA